MAGKSLLELRNPKFKDGPRVGYPYKSWNKFSQACILQIGIQLIRAIRDLHKLGFVHCDLKPNNILTSFKSDSNQLLKIDSLQKNVFIIDFGLAERYIDDNGTLIPHQRAENLSGYSVFLGTNAMNFMKQSRKDDMESLMYCLIYLVNNKTEWAHEDIYDQRKQFYEILKSK